MGLRRKLVLLQIPLAEKPQFSFSVALSRVRFLEELIILVSYLLEVRRNVLDELLNK